LVRGGLETEALVFFFPFWDLDFPTTFFWVLLLSILNLKAKRKGSNSMEIIVAKGRDEKGRRKRSLLIGRKLSKHNICNRNSEINEENSFQPPQ
jgi:hypothetical protein